MVWDRTLFSSCCFVYAGLTKWADCIHFKMSSGMFMLWTNAADKGSSSVLQNLNNFNTPGHVGNGSLQLNNELEVSFNYRRHLYRRSHSNFGVRFGIIILQKIRNFYDLHFNKNKDVSSPKSNLHVELQRSSQHVGNLFNSSLTTLSAVCKGL